MPCPTFKRSFAPASLAALLGAAKLMRGPITATLGPLHGFDPAEDDLIHRPDSLDTPSIV